MAKRTTGLRRPRRATVLGSVAVFAVLLAALPAAADVLDTIISAQVGSDRSAQRSQDEIDAIAEQTEELLQEYRLVVRETESLRAYNDQISDLIDAQDKEIRTIESQLDNIQDTERGLLPLMERMIETLDRFVQLDIPFLVEERTARVEELRTIFDQANVTTAEKYRRILEAYQTEMDYGRNIEAYEADLERDGEVLSVNYLRIGRLVLIYMTPDLEEAGYWDHRRGEWVDLPETYYTSVVRGLRVARQQAAPELLRLPVETPTQAPEPPAFPNPDNQDS